MQTGDAGERRAFLMSDNNLWRMDFAGALEKSQILCSLRVKVNGVEDDLHAATD